MYSCEKYKKPIFFFLKETMKYVLSILLPKKHKHC